MIHTSYDWPQHLIIDLNRYCLHTMIKLDTCAPACEPAYAPAPVTAPAHEHALATPPLQ